jgi:hypothetical protein
MKPLPSEPRPRQPAAPASRLRREIAIVLAVKALALSALWWAFFSPSSSSSGERPPGADLGRSFLERQPVSPDSPRRSPA